MKSILSPRWAAVVLNAAAPALVVAAQTFAVGEQVEIEASGRWVPCVVTENNPEFVMRVQCAAVPELSRDAGVYTVNRDDPEAVRKTGGALRRAPAVPAPKKPAATGGLRIGEYACYGSGGRILAGLGFKILSGNRYSDLDEADSGSYTVEGNSIKFRGGHLDGTVGRDLSSNRFRIAKQADCEPF